MRRANQFKAGPRHTHRTHDVCHCAEGWICERHPEQPWPHDDCTGPGEPCSNPDCPWWRGLAPTALTANEWTKVVAGTKGMRRWHRLR